MRCFPAQIGLGFGSYAEEASDSVLLEIYNMVIQALGGEDKDARMLSALDASTKGGRLVRLYWPQARRKTLASQDWFFAIEQSEMLEAEATAPNFEYRYRFDLANREILRICSVHDSSGRKADTKWQQEGDYLLWDQEYCFIRYITDIEDASRYSPNFIETAVLECALLCAMALTGKQEIEDSIYNKLHGAAIPAAKAAGGAEKYDEDEGYEDIVNAGM